MSDVSYPPVDVSTLMMKADAELTISGFETRIAALEKKGPHYLNDITLTQSALIAINAGPRTLTVTCNCLPGDRMFMTPTAPVPPGYMLGDISCTEAGKAVVTLFAPLLAVGGNYTIQAKVTAFRQGA